ncbi:MAG: DUF1254 domain-containing protein [Novosphingobium sp.]
MNHTLKFAMLFIAGAAIGHVGLVLAAPSVIMGAAIKRASHDGAAINQFQFGPRTTKDSRAVVRPSPDLAYSTCIYDLSGGPLLISAAPSPNQGYVSVSVFAANTDNIAVFDNNQQPQGIRFVLAQKGQSVPAATKVVYSPSARGIILDRRLAPNAELFAAADQARRADTCAPLKG